MRIATVAATLALALSTLATGCALPGGSCGGYAGGGDRVLARGTDTMVLCDNGGFDVTTAAAETQGLYALDAANTDITHAWITNTQQVAFTLTEQADGTSLAPELGAGAWTEVTLDTVGLDHANTLCVNLTAAAWWTGSAAAAN